MYGLFTGAEVEIPEQFALNVYCVSPNDRTGAIGHIRGDWTIGYSDSFITKNNIPLLSDGAYDVAGTTHYLDRRLSLKQFNDMSEEDLDAIFSKFQEKHPETDTNFERTWRGLLAKLTQGFERGYKKANQVSDSLEAFQLDLLDAQLPGSKLAVEHITNKSLLGVLKMEEALDKKLEKIGDTLDAKAPMRKPSLDNVISKAALTAAERNMQDAARVTDRAPVTPFDERSLF